jgi:hypothetical protein
MVSFSGSTFPRHWAWSHGGLPCAALAWFFRFRIPLRAPQRTGCPGAPHPYQARGRQGRVEMVRNQT